MKDNKYLTYVIAFLVIAVIGAVVYLKFGSSSNSDDKTNPTDNEELVIADRVKANKSSLNIANGDTSTFTLTVNNSAAGIIEIKSSDENVVKVTTDSEDCNEGRCFFDAPAGKSTSIEYTVTAVGSGNASIDIRIVDVLTYDEEPITGSNSISVSVK